MDPFDIRGRICFVGRVGELTARITKEILILVDGKATTMNATMEAILSNRRYRYLFYTLSGLLVVLLLLVRYVLVPFWDPNISGNGAIALSRLTEGLTSSLIVTILVGSFLFFVTPAVMKVAKVEPVEPKVIGDLLKAASATSTTWTFRGAMGRYTRGETLPSLVKRARDSGVRRKLRLIVLDPENKQACHEYAQYRNGVSSLPKSEPLTQELVREQIWATILAATRVSLTQSMIDIQIFIAPIWSIIRIDLSDDVAIMTSEDPREPGLRIDRGSHFYGTYSKELDFLARQSRQLKNLDISSGLRLDCEADIRRIIDRLGASSDLDEQQLQRVFQLVTSKDHPYA